MLVKTSFTGKGKSEVVHVQGNGFVSFLLQS
jgi:hypothetical protein